MRTFSALIAVVCAAVPGPAAAPPPSSPAVPRVEVWQVPDDGIQPQAVMDAAGTLHLLYFKGAPDAGDLFYVVRRPGDDHFSTPIRVNSQPGSALAKGSVRGGQLALGAAGQAHAAWYGAQETGDGAAKRRPIWYARLAPGGLRFEPQGNVATSSTGIDGATIAADQRGAVYVAWHGQGAVDGEAHRTVYVAKSTDAGAHFAPEQPAAQATTGACGCCGLRALTDSSGTAHILYRAATGGTNRDAAWLTLGSGAAVPVVLQRWKLDACPMSTFALAPAGAALSAAWETEQQIYFARLDPATGTVSPPVAMDGAGARKHPSVATNSAGVTLVAWTEGTGWARGGTLAWELLDAGGRRLETRSDMGAVPVWGLVAAASRPDGSFVILR